MVKGNHHMDEDWMDMDIAQELEIQGATVADATEAPPPRAKAPAKPVKTKKEVHNAKMKMKLQQKNLRQGNGAASLRIKPAQRSLQSSGRDWTIGCARKL